MYGILRAGGIVAGGSPACTIEEMTYALEIASASFLFTTSQSIKIAQAAARKVGIRPGRILLLEGKVDGVTSMSDLLSIGKSYGLNQIEEFKIAPGQTNKQICGYLAFSSGTTGLPKAVMISHANVIAQCLQMHQVHPPTYNRLLAVLPLFHITGLVHQLHLPLFLNMDVVLLPSFTMESMLAAIQEFRLEELLLVPPLLIRLAREEKLLDRYDLSSVSRFASGAAPASFEILELLKRRFPGTGFKQGYGMTETCGCVTAHPLDSYSYDNSRFVGTIIPSTEIKIINLDTGRECGVHEHGEILARGPQITMGYLNNEKATKQTFEKDGWLHTGDIGMMNKDGWLTITDRLKELIKVNGVGIAPAELEDLILGYPNIEDAAVLGIPDEYSGERPKAFIVLQNSSQRLNPEVIGAELIKYVQRRKTRQKWLKEVEIVDEIPKSTSGKILRRVLRDRKAGKPSIKGKDQRSDARL